MWPFQDKQKEDREAIVNEIIGKIKESSVTNATDTGLRGRMAAAMSGGYDGADTLHNVYLDYGYPESLEFGNFWNMYRRFGIAKNVVELPVDTGWSTPPTIESGDKFTNELAKLEARIPLWVRLKGLDLRQRVGRYGGLYMRVKDGKNPEEPIDGTLPGEAALFDIIPLYESQLEVTESDSDPMSETFGAPIMFQYQGSVEGNRNENTQTTIKIHASRVVIAAEGADDGSIYGIPALEPVVYLADGLSQDCRGRWWGLLLRRCTVDCV